MQTAAVAGNSFSAGVAARMLDVPVLALLGPLEECRAAGFLVVGDRPGDHRFSHALVRSAVAARLLSSWESSAGRFTKVMPKDYKRVLSAASAAEREGRDVNEAVMAAAHG